MNVTSFRSLLVWGLAAGLLVFLPGCQDLSVDNETQPTQNEVLGTPSDVEGLAPGMWETYFANTQGNFGTDWNGSAPMLGTMSDTYSCNWANFGMNDMSSEPRIAWNNNPAYSRSASVENVWFKYYSVISNASDVLSAINNIGEDQFEAQGVDVTRLKAFANFMMGVSYGQLAARYDRAFLVDQNTDYTAIASGDSDLELQPYSAVADFGQQKLATAISLSQQGHSNIPSNWIWGLSISSSQFAALANSYRARQAVMVARTPEERRNIGSLLESVDGWAQIKTWIENGLETTGYSGQFASQTFEYSRGAQVYPFETPTATTTIPAGFAPISEGGFGTDGLDTYKWLGAQPGFWSRADYKMIGPADTTNDASDCQGDATGDNGQTSCYKEWLNTDVGDRNPYVTETPDRRIQGDGGPQSSGSDFTFVGTAFNAFPPSRGTYHYSDRTFTRYLYHPADGGPNGPMPLLVKPEMDLLKAEALLHTGGDKSTIASLINNTRVENGEWDPATANDPRGDLTDGPNPVGDFPVEKSLFSMMQYEYLIEVQQTTGGIMFFNRRAWGDLPEGTPLHFPVPGAELETLQLANYTFGGVGGRCSIGNPTDCFGGSDGGNGSNNILSGKTPAFLNPPATSGPVGRDPQ